MYDDMGNWINEDIYAGGGSAEDTFRNQTPTREQYYADNPTQKPVFNHDEQTYLDNLAHPDAGPGTGPAVGGGPTARDLNADWAEAIKDLTANERDQGPLNTVAERLRAKGYKVELPATDMYGRNQGLMVDGQLYRVIDSSNNWTLKAGSDAWGSNDTGGYGKTLSGSAFSFPEWLPPDFNTPPWETPAPFDYAEYQPLTKDTFQADPGYEFRRTEGERPIRNEASARGYLRSPATLKALMAFDSGLASQEFGNADARSFRNWQSGRTSAADIYDRNLQTKQTDFMTRYNTEADKFNRSNSLYDTNFNTAATTAGINLGENNNQFRNRLSLYDLSTRSLPREPTPTANPAQFGFQY